MRSDDAAGTAEWLGPTKLSRAILFATATTSWAYLPFLLLHGDNGEFIFSLRLVIRCSLVASRIVSMTFAPLMGQVLFRDTPKPQPVTSLKPQHSFSSSYYRVRRWAIEHRKRVLSCSLLFLIIGRILVSPPQSSFFPSDLQYLSYADIWLPEGAAFAETNAANRQVEQVIKEVSARYANDPHREIASANLSPELGVSDHFNRSRAITVSCYPVPGMLSSNVLDAATPQMREMEKHLPQGIRFSWQASTKKRTAGFPISPWRSEFPS
jgi:multidrug efflux pump subunit AcrB